MSDVVGRCGSAKRIRHIAALPHDLMHVIFSKLKFRDKVNAGKVCKQWDQLLKAGTDNPRHWDVDYIVDSLVPSTTSDAAGDLYKAEQSITWVDRYGAMHTQTLLALTDSHKYACEMSQMKTCIAQD
jgi:hypothetical protein